MHGPIVFISHSRVKEGKLEDFRAAVGGSAPMIERDKPGTVVFLAYAGEDGTEAHVVHVFPDADAMARHLEGAAERVAKSMAFIETIGYEIYGSPSEPVLETMRGFATSSGADLRVHPDHLGGYLRPAPPRSD